MESEQQSELEALMTMTYSTVKHTLGFPELVYNQFN